MHVVIIAVVEYPYYTLYHTDGNARCCFLHYKGLSHKNIRMHYLSAKERSVYTSSISVPRRISAFAGRRIITVTPLRGRTPAKKG